jgi:hypothetical protein
VPNPNPYASSRIIYTFRPGIHDLLAGFIHRKLDACLGERASEQYRKICWAVTLKLVMLYTYFRQAVLSHASSKHTRALIASGITIKGISVSGRTKQL